MRKTYFIFIALFSFSLIFGQSYILTSHYHIPRPGDKIVKQQVEYKDPGRSGENILWDFGRLKSLDDEYSLLYHSPSMVSDTVLQMGRERIFLHQLSDMYPVVGTEHNTSYYYKIKNDSLLLSGYRNATVDVHHSQPVLLNVYPLTYGKEISGKYTGEGTYCGRIPMYLSGNIYTAADAFGMIVLPDGDTLRNVLRTKTIRYIHEYTPVSSAEEDLQADTLHIYMETYRWYVKGYRYPVFETIHTANLTDGIPEPFFSTAFFYPPQEHYYLESDPDNLSLLFGEELSPGEEENPGWQVNPGETFSCNFYPNPVKEVLTIEYYMAFSGDVEVALYNISGRILAQETHPCSGSGIYRQYLDMSGFREDTYILKIKSPEKEVSEIILKK